MSLTFVSVTQCSTFWGPGSFQKENLILGMSFFPQLLLNQNICSWNLFFFVKFFLFCQFPHIINSIFTRCSIGGQFLTNRQSYHSRQIILQCNIFKWWFIQENVVFFYLVLWRDFVPEWAFKCFLKLPPWLVTFKYICRIYFQCVFSWIFK